MRGPSGGVSGTLARTMVDVWARLEPHLASVQKPARYIGCELGAEVPSPAPGRVGWLLVYPDTYEIGLPNQGLQILYEILNERPDAVAERSYAPWTDLEEVLRREGMPLFSVDTHRSADEFDVLAFNLSAELVYTNVLNCLDLAGVPVRVGRPHRRAPARRRRRPRHLQPRAAGRLPRLRRARRRRGGRRRDQRGRSAAWIARRPDRAASTCCARWPASRACTCPALYEARYLPDGRLEATVPIDPAAPAGRREAHHRRPGRLALPEAAAGAAHRGGARPPQRRGVPRLHPGLPLLPGRDDHPSGARAAGRPGALDGRSRACAAPATTRWRSPACPPPTSPGIEDVVATAMDDSVGCGNVSVSLPSLRVDAFTVGDRRPDPEGPAHRPHLRTRGGHVADAPGDQQAHHRGRPLRRRRLGLQPGLAAREALLPHRAPHRDRRGHPRHHRAGPPLRGAGQGQRPQRLGHGERRRVRARRRSRRSSGSA